MPPLPPLLVPRAARLAGGAVGVVLRPLLAEAAGEWGRAASSAGIHDGLARRPRACVEPLAPSSRSVAKVYLTAPPLPLAPPPPLPPLLPLPLPLEVPPPCEDGPSLSPKANLWAGDAGGGDAGAGADAAVVSGCLRLRDCDAATAAVGDAGVAR